MIDALCTNPGALPESRSTAIDLVVTKLIEVASELGLIGIVSFSGDLHTLERSERFGFKRRPDQTIIGLNLGR